MAPRISVVIPLYNRAGYIVETLDSIASQHTQPHEVIVVDDASTDDSMAVVEAYRQRSPLALQLVSNTRQKGVSGATNTGMQLATGELIALHDSDDLWTPQHLQQLTQVLAQHSDIDFAFSAFEFFGDSSDVTSNAEHFKASVKLMMAAAFECTATHTWVSNAALLESILGIGFVFRCQASLMRRSAIERHHLLFEEALSFTQDSHFMTLAASHGRFAYVDRLGVRVRRHQENSAPDYYGEKIINGYALRAKLLKAEFGHRSLTPAQRKALNQRLWNLQSQVMWSRSRGQPLGTRLQHCGELLSTVPSVASLKSCIKNLLSTAPRA